LVIAAFSTVAVVRGQDMAYTVTCPEGAAEVVVAAGAVGVELEVVQEQADRFMALCPDITVTTLETPDLATDRLGLYQQFWQAQSPDVDVYQVDVIWAGIIAEHMVDLNEYAPEGYFDAFFPAMIEGQNIDGRQVAVPWFTDAAGLYYRDLRRP
jgi:trehalose/maltose transport system substrate-binding protein